MVFLPPGAPYNILEPYTAFFQRVMDGGPIGPAPHRVCDIVETFTLDNIEFRPGMQGEILEKATDEGGVQWAQRVPLDKIKIGSDWKGHDDGWRSHEHDFVGAASAGHQEEKPESSKKTVHEAS